ncbi:MAG: hypothetical protein KDD25_06980, partial [Bdellovibrionales bacterium]|nr:hypothetical protein [Bdellovibrionales bacterium]
AAKSGKPKLKAYISANFEWAKSSPTHASLYLLFHYYSTYKPEYRELQKKVRAGGLARVGGLLDPIAVAENWSAAKKNDISHAIYQQLTGALLEALSTTVPGTSDPTWDSAEKNALKSADLLLNS